MTLDSHPTQLDAQPIVEVRDVHRRYDLGGEELWALKGVSLQIHPGEFLSIMGPSGSGKSTLFNQIGALDRPTSGEVLFLGTSILGLNEAQQSWIRCHHIGYIFQTFNLIPVMTALQNVALPLVMRGETQSGANARATEILDRVGLGHRLHHRPLQLSGGQQQRVSIARALANKPSVILADEPTGNLDTATGEAIIDLLQELNRENHVTVICSTHDPKMLHSSHRVCWMNDGRLDRIVAGSEFTQQMLMNH